MKRFILPTVILGALLLILGRTVNIAQLTEAISHFPLYLLFISIGFAILLSVMKSVRLSILLKSHDIEISFWQVYRLFVATQAITPLPGGEASRAYLLNKETGVPVQNAASPVLMQALLELFSAVVLVIVGSFFYHTLLGPGLISLGLLIVLIILLTHPTLLHKILSRLSRFEHIARHSEQIQSIQKDLRENIYAHNSRIPSRTITYTFLLALFTNIVGGILLMLIARGFGENLSVFQATFVYSAGIAISGLATITPGGIGFTEGGMAGILNLFRIKDALPIVIIFRFVTFIFYILLGLVFITLFYRNEFLFPKNRKGGVDEN